MDDHGHRYCWYSGVSGTDEMERWKIAEIVSNRAQTLEEVCTSKDIPARILIVRNGRAAHWKSDCPFFSKSTSNPDTELVFSL